MNSKEIFHALKMGEISPKEAEKELRKILKPEENRCKPETQVKSQSAVDLCEIEPGIVQLTMQDSVHKNAFSEELSNGLVKSFELIQANSDYKVVILTGYDSYFASGGTQEGLMAIYDGKIKYTDTNVYRLALDCRIPVIAAMQGHGIGGGWCLGMSCDFPIMSLESYYTTNFMKFGFTPGFGSTLIFPEKFGSNLAQEILFTGEKYRGSDLEARGVPFTILPRKEVLPYAIQLARKLAGSPRETLVTLKDHMAESMRQRLSVAIEKEVKMHEKTFVNQPEVKERINLLYGQLPKISSDGSASSQTTKQAAGAQKNQFANNPIAVIGMSGQFPKSKNVAELWDNIANGRDCISEIPAEKWSVLEYYDSDPEAPGKTYSKWMGSVEDIDKFDPLFFSIPPSEAELMDPQQRLFLENCWHCIEDAGLSPSSLYGSKSGVFVGCGIGDYQKLINDQGLSAQGLMGVAPSILTARISYILNLKGPCLAIETACSSSLVAIAEACNNLVLKTCDMALAGGVYLTTGPDIHISTSKSGMLSKDGKCYTFDARANGFVPGEGVGVILLKRLEDAIRDGDPIHGVIRGWGVNQDGKTNGITAPSVNSQIDLEKEVYERFNINPETITLVEAHGTGTKLGDPIEVEALTEAFQSFTDKKKYCALGSVKSNIGHLLIAAGVTGTIKVLMALKHKMLPPTINFKSLNEHIALDNSPFYVNTELKPWDTATGMPRRACVSAFGFSGTNAHVVIEEYIPENDSSIASVTTSLNNNILFVLSAKSMEQLKIYAENIKEWLISNESVNLEDMAYTLQIGRNEMNHRLSFLADSKETLLRALEGFIDGNPPEGVYTAQIKKGKNNTAVLEEGKDGKALLQTLIEEGNIQKIPELWVKGLSIDWNQIYGENKPHRINMPTYPFARESYWVPLGGDKPGADIPDLKPIADLADKEQFVPRKMCFLDKQWKPTLDTSIEKMSDKTVAILATQEVKELAGQVSQHFTNSKILFLDDFALKNQQQEYDWKVFDGFIDLIGCGQDKNESIDWIIWVQQLIDQGKKEGLMLLCVTKALESYHNTDMNLSGASRVGLYRMLQSEYSSLRSRHMDFDAASSDKELSQQIAAEFLVDSEDTEVCYRKGKRYCAFLEEFKEENRNEQTFAFPKEHVLLITGGTRGLGYLCARHFAENYGVRRIVLTGREEIPAREQWDLCAEQNLPVAKKIKSIRALEALGVQVQVLSIPLEDENAVKNSLEEIKKTMGPIGGVIHCAVSGDNDNPAFIRKPLSSIQKLINTKVTGLDIIYKYFKNEPLKFFILFSSVSSIIPTLATGQSDYAMGNAYMDYFAEANVKNCPIISIQWPSWKDTGMGEVKSKAYKNTGLLSITDSEGLQLLDEILSKRIGPLVLPAVVNPDLWKPHQLMQPRIQDISSKGIIPMCQSSANSSNTSDDLVNAAEVWLTELFAKELKINCSKLEKDTPFQDYGVDSIILAQILRSINKMINCSLDPSIIYEYPTIESLAMWLASSNSSALMSFFSIKASQQPSVISKVDEKGKSGSNPSDIAVIGLTCRFPGANSLEEFWSLLSEGRSAIGRVPEERWGYKNNYYAGLIDDARRFDSKFFLIHEDDVKAMDPQALLLLEESLKLWHHAGYSHNEIKGKNIGVYIGGRSQHIPDEISLCKSKNPILAVGQNYLASNVSQFFDLRGPSLVVDTSCSSGLVAMNMAIQALNSGEIESALVGGVSFLGADAAHRIFEQRGILSNEPAFHLFDRRAGGVVLGEGVGMVLLKRLDQALCEGDTIYTVIKGIAVNNDGRTAGPTTPNLQAQRDVMQTALAKSGRKAGEVSYIEVNGSGSEITDLLELKAIQSSYRSLDTVPFGLGSIKPNIGHPLCAKGIASFIKIVLMLQHRQIVPFLSGNEPMNHFDMDKSPFYFSRELTEWKSPSPVAAINCFADGGTNAHVVLEGWEESAPREIKRHPIPLPVLQRKEVQGNINNTSSDTLNEMVWETYN